MAHLKDLIVNGASRFIGKAYGVFVGTFNGNLVGNANTATKLQTPRAISLTGNAMGTANFDGSGDANISVTVNDSKHSAAADTLKSSAATETSTVARPVWLSWEGDNTRQTVSPNLIYTCSTKTLTAANFKGHLVGNADTATNAAAANALNNVGEVSAIEDGTREPSGLTLHKVYNNGYPTPYGNVISIGGTGRAGGGELLAEWSGADKGIGHLFYRNRRDAGNLWSDWRTVAFTSDINSYAPTKTGTGASGTWPISISGNAATATTATTATKANGLTGSLNFSDIGDVATSNKISWSGSTDGADIYYQTTAADQGNLVLNLRDDANCYLRIAYNGEFKSYFTPTDGNFHGNVNGKSDSAGSADTSAAINYSNIGTNYIKAGSADTGDAANQTANMVIGSWYGITFYDVCGNKIAGGMNVRDGSLTMKGTITGSKVYNAVYNDYAEFFEKDEDTAFEAGDIVALDTSSEEERYIKATEDSIVVVGVCTHEYAHIIGGKGQTIEENEKEFVPISLMGRVHVKVDDTVKRGDKVTASKVPGIGRKAMPGEHSIGTALTNPSNGKVRVLINL